jgi:hypothetical protein
METTAVDAPRASGRFHVDPALTAATVGWVLAFGGAFVWRLLVYGLGREVTDWRLLGCVGINAITLVLLWGERRRVLAHAPREAGADEASWGKAAADLAMRQRLAHPGSLAFVAIFVVLFPWTLWVWDRYPWMIVASFGSLLPLLVADTLAHKRAVREGSMDALEGAQVPPGWWVLGTLAIGLPLVWLPMALMAGGVTSLRILSIPILNGIAWWWASARWQGRWRVDRRLRAIPVDWHRRARFAELRFIPYAALWLTYLLAMPFEIPESNELMGSGCIGQLLWLLWWHVILGLLGTGVFFHTRQVRPPTLGAGAASKSR